MLAFSGWENKSWGESGHHFFWVLTSLSSLQISCCNKTGLPSCLEKKNTCLQSLLLSWSMELFSSTQPPRVARKNGSSVGTRTRCTHVFARLGCRLARSVGALPTKSLNRSSGGSLLRASCCWLVGLGSKCFLTWLPRGS